MAAEHAALLVLALDLDEQVLREPPVVEGRPQELTTA
jgi:hypothetical protein